MTSYRNDSGSLQPLSRLHEEGALSASLSLVRLSRPHCGLILIGLIGNLGIVAIPGDAGIAD